MTYRYVKGDKNLNLLISIVEKLQLDIQKDYSLSDEENSKKVAEFILSLPERFQERNLKIEFINFVPKVNFFQLINAKRPNLVFNRVNFSNYEERTTIKGLSSKFLLRKVEHLLFDNSITWSINDRGSLPEENKLKSIVIRNDCRLELEN